MDEILKNAAAKGYEGICAWADLLDEINVFPVADGDTGRNLKISLSPLAALNSDHQQITKKILATATGNAGNIAAAFFSEFFLARTAHDLSNAARRGRDKAWTSIADPKEGTMLTFFDRLDLSMCGNDSHDLKKSLPDMLQTLGETVGSTADALPELRHAQVVDAGALGMFIFFGGFLRSIAGYQQDPVSISQMFGDKIKVSKSPTLLKNLGYCVNATLSPEEKVQKTDNEIKSLGDSVIVVPGADDINIHLHTRDTDSVKEKLSHLGTLKRWHTEKMSAPVMAKNLLGKKPRVHIMTDAAGSLTPKDASILGITLLDSYLVVGDSALHETLFNGQELYHAMKKGEPVSTAQASLFERHQCYKSVTARFDQILYLTVGSFYTGNYKVVEKWRQENDVDEKVHCIDTGVASGRLGLIATATARFAAQGHPMEMVARYARRAINACDELIFLDQLKYLAAGGRISKTRGFFGDLLGLKPVISPRADGAKKAGLVRKKRDQLPFALDYMEEKLTRNVPVTILLEYSDNRERIEGEIKDGVADKFPKAEIKVRPLSLTSGAHMGPGTWGIAFMAHDQKMKDNPDE